MENEVRAIVECGICTDFFSDPRMLPCIHSFCLKCLDQAAAKSQLRNGDSMLCPICRTPFVIPKEGMIGLRKNFFVERLVDVVKIARPPAKTTLCEICEEDCEEEATGIAEAKQYCIQCCKSICDRCCRDHQRFQDLKKHQLIALGSPLKDEFVKKITILFCDQHKDEQAKLYCVDCKNVICMMCFAEQHKAHQCSDVEKLGDRYRADIVEKLKKIKSMLAETDKQIQMVDTEQMDLETETAKAEKAIVKREKKLKEMIEKSTKSLLNELASIKKQNLKELETKKEEMERHRAIIESLVLYYDQMISKGSAAEICRSVADLQSRNEDLQKIHRSQKWTSFRIVFEALKIESFDKAKNVVGSIAAKSIKKSSARTVSICSVECLDISISRYQEATNSYFSYSCNYGMTRNITGMAKIANSLYVLCQNEMELLVFEDEKPFNIQKTIPIDEINYPFNIASCGKSRCLYIADSDSYCIWKIPVDEHGSGGGPIQWLRSPTCPNSLFVNSDGHLVVLTLNGSPYQLNIHLYENHGTNAKLSQSHVIPSVSENPYDEMLESDSVYEQCCVQKPSGEFIICLKDLSTEQFRIIQVSSDGRKIISQFRPEEQPEKLTSMRGLALDSDNDLLFTVEYKTGRILVLDSNSLKLEQILETEELLKGYVPCNRPGLLYDSKKQLTVVRQENPGKIDVYKLDNNVATDSQPGPGHVRQSMWGRRGPGQGSSKRNKRFPFFE